MTQDLKIVVLQLVRVSATLVLLVTVTWLAQLLWQKHQLLVLLQVGTIDTGAIVARLDLASLTRAEMLQ